MPRSLIAVVEIPKGGRNKYEYDVDLGGIRFDQICLRMMALKCFHDLFVTGDGSRRTLAARIAASRDAAA